jgi:uncharacterized protein YjdB
MNFDSVLTHFRVLFLSLLVLLSGCGGFSASASRAVPTLAGIAVTPGTATVALGNATSFAATGKYSDGTTVDLTGKVTWASANPAIAAISDTTGVAKGVALGSTTVTASLKGITSPPASVTVTSAVVASISITPATASAPTGTTVMFTAMAIYSDGTSGNVSGSVIWASSNSTVAMLNGSGIASALAQGSTTVTASANGVTSNSASLTVTAPLLTTITINPVNASMPIGLTANFTASGTYSDGTTADITSQVNWSSANPAVATINSSSGVATGVALGATTVTAAAGGITASAVNVTVTAAVITAVSVTPNAATAPRGTTVTFTATGTYSDGSTGNISGSVAWVSGNPAVAPVNASGIVTAREVWDSVVITATSANGVVSNNAFLTVTPAVLASLSITPLSASIAVGGTQQFTATGTMTDGTAATLGTVTWMSSAPAAATVDTTGLATAVGAGSTNISASSSGITSNSVVLVVN